MMAAAMAVAVARRRWTPRPIQARRSTPVHPMTEAAVVATAAAVAAETPAATSRVPVASHRTKTAGAGLT